MFCGKVKELGYHHSSQREYGTNKLILKKTTSGDILNEAITSALELESDTSLVTSWSLKENPDQERFEYSSVPCPHIHFSRYLNHQNRYSIMKELCCILVYKFKYSVTLDSSMESLPPFCRLTSALRG